MFRLVVDDDVELRLLEPHYADELFRAIDGNRNHLSPWLAWVERTRTVGDTQAFIYESLKKLAAGKSITSLIRCEGRVAGVLGAFFRRDDETCELGYWLTQEFQGRGLVTRSILTILPYLFEERGLHRLEIHCAPDNHRSCAIPERLGFRLEAALREAERIGERRLDTRIYALLRPEWRAGRRFA